MVSNTFDTTLDARMSNQELKQSLLDSVQPGETNNSDDTETKWDSAARFPLLPHNDFFGRGAEKAGQQVGVMSYVFAISTFAAIGTSAPIYGGNAYTWRHMKAESLGHH